ncbi:putative RNA methyltransferase Atu0735 [Nymphon striatum]|nr:putative RNA methyltransferase Atu0735 [Nymphon striatum]
MAEPGAQGIFLIKPQFEVGKDGLGKGGVVRDEALAIQTAHSIRDWLDNFPNWSVTHFMPSPLKGGDGNKEFLMAATKMTELKIDFVGHQGDGVAHLNGHAIYVPYALEGETVSVDGSGPRRDIHARPKACSLGLPKNPVLRLYPLMPARFLFLKLTGQLEQIRDLVNSVPTLKHPLRVSVLVTKNGLDISIEDGKPLSEAERQVLIKKSITHKFSRLTVNQDTLIKTAEPHIEIANTIGCKHVADLYCGIGTFALKLAENSAVYAVEESGDALESLDQAWRQTGGKLKQVKTEKRNLERRPVTFGELKKMDGLVFDPPRAGAELQCRQIAKSRC